MAKGIKKAIREKASGGISKSELKKIAKQTQAPVQQVIRQMDVINKKAKQAGKTPPVSLNSGAANMLIKRLQNQPVDPFNRPPSMGTGNIAKSLQGMIGGPTEQERLTALVTGRRAPNPPGTGLMIGGTQIRPGGRIAVRRFGQSADTTTTTTEGAGTPGLTEDEINKRIQEGIQSGINDYFNTLDLDSIYGQQTQDQGFMDLLAGMGDMFSSAFGNFQQQNQNTMDLMSQFAAPQFAAPQFAAPQFAAPQEAMRSYGAGQNYNIDAIRAAQRNQQRRSGYLRGGMGIGGQSGVTTGVPTSGLNIGSALGILGGVTG
jgi:hypothetical protein